jgi:hypothetical protein
LALTPPAALEVATKLYVDNSVAAALHFHSPVRVESPIALTVTYNNGTAGVGATLTNAGTQAALVIDGVTLKRSRPCFESTSRPMLHRTASTRLRMSVQVLPTGC